MHSWRARVASAPSIADETPLPPTHILGISAYYHDSAACLLRDGEIVAAAQEERFTRKKGDAAFPSRAVEYCLREGGISLDNAQAVGFYDKPLLKFERILETYLSIAPKGFRSFRLAGPLWIKEKLFMASDIRRSLGGWDGPLMFAEHHESHAASAFFPSPFEEAAILTVDGVGEWATTTVWTGKGSRLVTGEEGRDVAGEEDGGTGYESGSEEESTGEAQPWVVQHRRRLTSGSAPGVEP